jgi:ATP phosphoribosyltransferase
MNQPVLDDDTTLLPTIVLAPKNRGLYAQALRALDTFGADTRESASMVRGEDIPMIATALAQSGRNVLGLTGEDLLEEWIARGNRLDPRIQRRKIPWDDPSALYGKPALCFIGKESPARNGRMRVAVASRYRELAGRYLRTLEARGATVERIPVSGALETVYAQGIADFIVDIVVTGATMRQYGLNVLDVVFTSDLAVLEA